MVKKPEKQRCRRKSARKSLTGNPDSPRIAIAYSGENIDRKSFNASKKYMRQAQKFGGTIPEGCDVRTPWQKFIDFLKIGRAHV